MSNASSSAKAVGAAAAMRRPQVPTLLQPAVRAYLLGYLLDVLPAVVKLFLQFFTSHARRFNKLRKRMREERKANINDPSRTSSIMADGIQPALRELPRLGAAIFRALLAAFGPTGMATASALAMASTAVLERLFVAAATASARSSGGAVKLGTQAIKRRTRQIQLTSTFVAASISSGAALYLLQCAPPPPSSKAKQQASTIPALSLSKAPPRRSMLATLNPFRASATKLELDAAAQGANMGARATPLAPGGHFLARFTALSVPGSPGAMGSATDGSRSPVDEINPSAASISPKSQDSDADANAEVQKVTHTSPRAAPSPLAASDEKAATDKQPVKLGRPSPTIDLTLFALVRALDTIARATPSLALLFGKQAATSTGSYASSQAIGPGAGLAAATAAASARAAQSKSVAKRLGGFVADQAEGLTFVVSCAVIMWNWFYAPECLPPTYVKWITNLAAMDERLLICLRGCRKAKPCVWRYNGDDTTVRAINHTGGLAESLGHPYEWGDPTRLPATAADARRMLLEARAENAAAQKEGRESKVSHPWDSKGEPGYILDGAAGPRGRGEMGGMPCELVHCGVGGANCYANAGLRWLRAFKVCIGIYLPVHLLPRLIFNPKGFLKAPLPVLIKVLQGSARSAAFLSTFIASIWFMVCVGRSLLLPKLFPSVSFNVWDGGLPEMMGCLTCGWSVFIEEKRKRAEMALYVAPRALFACAEMAKPGWASGGQRGALWTERILFGLSLGIVTSAGKYRPDLLRGMTSTMAWVVKDQSKRVAKQALIKTPRTA